MFLMSKTYNYAKYININAEINGESFLALPYSPLHQGHYLESPQQDCVMLYDSN